MSSLSPGKIALLLIGFQRDYFDPDGILYSVVEESHRLSGTLEHTIQVIDAIIGTSITIVNTPIVFSESYHEIDNPMGILKAIKDSKITALSISFFFIPVEIILYSPET